MLKTGSSSSPALTPYRTVRSNVGCLPSASCPVLSCLLPARLVCDCSRHTLHEPAHHSALHHYWVLLGWLSAHCVCTQQHGRPTSEPIFLLSSALTSSHLSRLTVASCTTRAHHHCPQRPPLPLHRPCRRLFLQSLARPHTKSPHTPKLVV